VAIESGAGETVASRGPLEARGRAYRGTRDWWRIRSLLIEARGRSPHGAVWDIRRWDGWRFHRAELPTGGLLADLVGLWETLDGRVVAAVHPEGCGDAYLEVDPEFRYLEPEIIRWAEEHLAVAGGTGRSLEFWVSDQDEDRCRLLAQLGYTAGESGGWMRCLRFDGGVAPPLRPLAAPYRMRTTDSSDEDCGRMADLLNAGFGRTVHSAAEIRNFTDRSPSFEHDLNLVAVASDGSFAATVGLTSDDDNRHGLVEPVCTHPDNRRHGLARALLLEGLRRLQSRGALTASLDTGEGEAANALYIECGFVEGHHFRPWRREFRRED
jgi:mycothiol synthase